MRPTRRFSSVENRKVRGWNERRRRVENGRGDVRKTRTRRSMSHHWGETREGSPKRRELIPGKSGKKD